MLFYKKSFSLNLQVYLGPCKSEDLQQNTKDIYMHIKVVLKSHHQIFVAIFKRGSEAIDHPKD